MIRYIGQDSIPMCYLHVGSVLYAFIITRYLGGTLECCSYLLCNVLSQVMCCVSVIPLQTVPSPSIKHLSNSCIMLCKGINWRDITNTKVTELVTVTLPLTCCHMIDVIGISNFHLCIFPPCLSGALFMDDGGGGYSDDDGGGFEPPQSLTKEKKQSQEVSSCHQHYGKY